MKKLFTPEVKIALVAIMGVVVLFLGMQFLKGLDLFSADTHYQMKFNDISGLSVSSPVYANGFKVGSVKSITYDYSNPGAPITVGVDIDKSMKVPAGTSADIVSDLMGNVKVDLVLGKGAAMLGPDGVIDGRINDGALGEMKSMVPTIQKMLPKLDSILASVNVLLADPAVKGSIHNVNQITSNLTTSTTELNRLLAQVNGSLPLLTVKAGKLMDNANGMMGNANGGITEARGAIRGANGMIATLNDKVSGIDVQGTMTRVNTALEHVNTLTAKLNSKEGSLGLLMNDPSLYNNLSNTMRDADSLMINLKAHPKRYVHFSLFGRKDK
ncbi:MAG: MlaD family protein [Prevotella sp.]|nr:MlaD family protein [Prevotella sp.]